MTNIIQPSVTESFAKEMLQHQEAMKSFEVRNATVEETTAAVREAYKLLGSGFINRSGDSLAAIVSGIIRTNRSLCA